MWTTPSTPWTAASRSLQRPARRSTPTTQPTGRRASHRRVSHRVSYTWDDNGNLTARGSDAFDWDAANRLVSATVESATTTFAYNGDGLRDSLTFDSNTTTFTWDVNRSIPPVLDDETYHYLYGVGRIAQMGASETHYYLTDGLGSILALTDEAGDLVNTYDYDVFGAVRAETGSQANDFTFAGEQVDGSAGLQYLRARYYDMEVGRFVSRDPWSGTAWDPSTQGSFQYVRNNPIRFVDPVGLCGLDDVDWRIWETVEQCVDEFISDEFNQFSVLQLGAGIGGSFSCAVAETGIGAAFCAGFISIYVGAIYGKADIICEDVRHGKYSPEEGKARFIASVLPLPSGATGILAKKIIQPVVVPIIDALHDDIGGCEPPKE